MKTLYNEKGFTLVEIIIVVLIIGVLVAIAVPLVHLVKADAQRRACQQNLRTVNGALETWKAGHPDSDYPSNETAIGTLTSDGYLKNTPQCPAGGSYLCTGGGGGAATLPIIYCSLNADTDGGHRYP